MAIKSLDRSSPMPLWAQLEAELRRRLDSGEFDDGPFPTDLQLTQDYGVSRHTVREAVRHVNSDGVLRRERGRGTVVDRTEFEQSLGTLYSLFRSIEATGVEQASEVLRLEVVTDDDAAGMLELDPSTELVLIARLRLANGEPLAIDRAWLEASKTRALLDVDWSHTALYDELARIDVDPPDQGWERLTPFVPNADDCSCLGMNAGEAAFHLERLGSRGDKPVEWRTTIVRGDRWRFVSDWSTTAKAELRPAAV